ncbi:MAG: ribosomal protein S18-alanine N-acetyltransferase [Eubacteriaceae bacterium]|jgi:ribosomal-protein-alanine N-acetyltransferase|nr:ribosomal protein S18-alanine N-acetyltransferase [Eubacteriaceae bacterium]
MNYNLRIMTEADAAEVHAIDWAAQVCEWSEESYIRESQNPVGVYYILEIDGRAVGYAGMWCVAGEAELMNIGILPDMQGRGYGQILLKTLLDHSETTGCAVMSLEVKEQNLTAIALYKKLGFEQIGFRKSYYKDGSNALLMQKRI